VTGERILVVDDEQSVVRSCRRILEREGYSVLGQTDSRAVPNLLRQETFDLLLTDIRMPRLTGLEVLELARQIDPHLTVVLITGYGTIDDAIKAIQLGAQGFLMKPYEPEALVATVRSNLERRALQRDSLRLQTLLPLLEINQILQVAGGEISLTKRVLDVALKATGAGRMAWLALADLSDAEVTLEEAAVVPAGLPSKLPVEALNRVIHAAQAVWVTSEGELVLEAKGQPKLIGALLPLWVKGKLAGVLTAETGRAKGGPFGPISLDLLSVVAGQLAMILENVQLFKEAEALRNFNEDIVQTMTNGLITLDQAGCITVFNPAAATMLGYAAQEVLGRPMSEVLAGADALAAIFKETMTMSQGQPRREIELEGRHGQRLPVSISTALLQGETGRVGVVGVLEDLREIKALEAERRRLDRLAALGQMSAVVAHEIRNPIAGIAAGVEYLTRNTPAGSLEAEGATLVQGEIKRVNRILEDILFVARPLQLTFSPADLGKIIEAVMRRCQPKAVAHEVELVLEAPADLPRLSVDAERLEQVFNNLIINAVQAMPAGGQVTIQVSDRPAEAVVMVSLTDTGPGIEAAILNQIFEPFFTTKTKGTGLGLSIVRRIVELHEGTIEVTSKPGQGTKFVVSLPRR
jgi:PAS domain S-box-containing protein